MAKKLKVKLGKDIEPKVIDKYHTVKSFADKKGVSTQYIYQLIKAKKIQVVQVNGCELIEE